jgi:valyl-tRNA synthetase
VRDEKGDKMSKTKGNVIDRSTSSTSRRGRAALHARVSTTGRDIPLGKSRIAGYSAFVNKIWNASRFALMHIDVALKDAGPIERENLRTVERWILRD